MSPYHLFCLLVALPLAVSQNPPGTLQKAVEVESTLPIDYNKSTWEAKFRNPTFNYLNFFQDGEEDDPRAAMKVQFGSKSPNEIALIWDPPTQTEGEILGYDVIYTYGQVPYRMEAINETQVNITLTSGATAVEACVAAYTRNNRELEEYYLSKTVFATIPAADPTLSAVPQSDLPNKQGNGLLTNPLEASDESEITDDGPIKLEGYEIAIIVGAVALVLAIGTGATAFLCSKSKGSYAVEQVR
nr:hypothetical transcript [Hymenolepis microstoma]